MEGQGDVIGENAILFGLQEVTYEVRDLFHSIVFTDMASLRDADVSRILVAL